MDKIYIMMKLDESGDYTLKAYADKDRAAADVMEEVYGEDWEMQMEDDDWDAAVEIRTQYEDLLDGYGFTDEEGVVWSITESDVIR